MPVDLVMGTKPHHNLVAVVQDAACRIYRELHSGFVEQVYREAMAVELRLLGLPYEVERNTEVFYRSEKIGLHRLDFIIDGVLVVELKVLAKLTPQNIAQTAAYLRTTGIGRALIVNFPAPEQDRPEFHVVTSVSPAQQLAKRKRHSRRHRRLPPALAPSSGGGKHGRTPLQVLTWDDNLRRYVVPEAQRRTSIAGGAVRHNATEIIPCPICGDEVQTDAIEQGSGNRSRATCVNGHVVDLASSAPST
jgi:GxxExxY protein